MLKKTLYILTVLLMISLSCTRDDICTPETSKTPLLIIRFFNAENPEAPKEVNAFTLLRDGDSLSLFPPVNTDSIAIPLDTGVDFTDYFFISNANDSLPDFDFISFTYERENEYINRACAFRTNYSNLEFTMGNLAPSSWIDNIIIQSDSVNARNQNEPHLHIYH